MCYIHTSGTCIKGKKKGRPESSISEKVEKKTRILVLLSSFPQSFEQLLKDILTNLLNIDEKIKKETILLDSHILILTYFVCINPC